MNNFRFQLSNTSRKQRCPQCGRLTFTPYIDTESNEPVGDGCGRCDRVNHCQYHYPPREYFKTHPKPVSTHSVTPKKLPPKPKQLYTLPIELVEGFHSYGSIFVHWFADMARKKGLDTELARKVYEDYRLGTTANRDVIFWQIDVQGRVRSGKIMEYEKYGHRTGKTTWVHAELKAQGKLTKDFELTQCFFGEHLLRQRPNDVVCLVESEKTAIVAALFFPQFIWIASGGCGGLSKERLEVLKDRRVIVYPDSGKLDEWSTKIKESNVQNYTMIDWLEEYDENIDLADVLLMDDRPITIG